MTVEQVAQAIVAVVAHMGGVDVDAAALHRELTSRGVPMLAKDGMAGRPATNLREEAFFLLEERGAVRWTGLSRVSAAG